MSRVGQFPILTKYKWWRGECSGNSDSGQEFCMRAFKLNTMVSGLVKVNSDGHNSTEGIDPETA